MKTRTRHLAHLTVGALLAVVGPAFAGPPYATDDPVPTDRGHWEIYNFVQGGHLDGLTSGEAGIDLNYGGATDLQLTGVLPLAFETGDGSHQGFGVIETAAKYRFVHQREDSWVPDVAIFPRVYWPTAQPRYASQKATVLLPLWFGKDLGAWSLFGGGGVQFNPGDGNRNFRVLGLALTRNLTDRLNLGAEVYGRSATTIDGHSLIAVNAGLTYKMTEHWSLLASGGPGLHNAATEGQYAFYLSLKADY
jgi:Putative MetA-pathway of phenol degradation